MSLFDIISYPSYNITHRLNQRYCSTSNTYRTRANKGRTYYSNENFLEIAAANNQERL